MGAIDVLTLGSSCAFIEADLCAQSALRVPGRFVLNVETPISTTYDIRACGEAVVAVVCAGQRAPSIELFFFIRDLRGAPADSVITSNRGRACENSSNRAPYKEHPACYISHFDTSVVRPTRQYMGSESLLDSVSQIRLILALQRKVARGSVKSCGNCPGASITSLHATSVLDFTFAFGSGSGIVLHKWAEINRRQVCSSRSMTW